MIHFRISYFFLMTILIGCFHWPVAAQDLGVADVRDSENILPERERARIMNDWLHWRLENVLPELMRREGFDMWLVLAREPNEDPVYLTLMPEPHMSAWRTSILIFHDEGEGRGVKRYSADKPSKVSSIHSIGQWYEGTWTDTTKTRFENLAAFIAKKDPKRIGINVSRLWSFGDGLSVGLKEKLEEALGPDLTPRLAHSDRLAVAWLETRSPQELRMYRHICGISHDIILDFFSNKVVVPDVTTTEDVEWWIRQRTTDLGLKTWFHPSISIHRHEKEAAKYADAPHIIRRGDLLHCDMGITYLGLDTDMQWNAYVCRIGETEAPKGLQNALDQLHRLKEIFLGEFREGRTGNQITDAAMEKAKAAGLRPLIYTHPIGVHGHGAGSPMDARPFDRAPEEYRTRGEYPLYPNTVYAIEFSATTNIPEWDGQELRLGFEDEGVFTKEGARLVDGYQNQLLLIR